MLGLVFLPLAGSFQSPATRTLSRPRCLSLLEKEEDTITTATIQDEMVDAPASVVFYDDLPKGGVVCARGVCVIAYDEEEEVQEDASMVKKFLNSYLGPRLMLAFASILYGTNFPLGAIMNEALTPSSATCARMVLAAAALSPFLPKLNPSLAGSALLCGCFTALGYTTQSLALVDTSPATVAFLGAATVIVCPALEAIVNKKPMSLREAPQIWLAAALCLTGVGILELFNGDAVGGLGQVGWGDVLAILQAVGFGTSFFLTERMMRGQPDQALPITAVQVSTTALICLALCISDGWIGEAGTESFGLPNLFLEPSLRQAAGAVAWTGLITTAMNRFLETTALGKVTSAEASVILATEPLWAALFAALLVSEKFGWNDYLGGALIVLACLANALEPENFSQFFKQQATDGNREVDSD